MLNHLVNKEIDAVEKYFCIPASEMQKSYFTDEQAQFTQNLIHKVGNDIVDQVKKEKNDDEYKLIAKLCVVIQSRLSFYHSYVINDQKLLFYIAVIASTPGNIVMYLTYIQWYAKKNNVKEIDLTIFCTDIFPDGFFSPEQLNELWEGQKLDPDSSKPSSNLLDYSMAAISIQL
jgi:hypothetical protein